MIKSPLLLNSFSTYGRFSTLKNVAFITALLQFWAAIIYLSCSILVPDSASASIACGILAILLAVTPFFLILKENNYSLIFSCINIFNLAPIWFIYLEAILPGYDAFEYSSPMLIMEAYYWVAVCQVIVNFFYYYFSNRISLISMKSFSFLSNLKIDPLVFARLTFISFSVPLLLFYFYYGSIDRVWIHFTAGRSEEGLDLFMNTVGGMGAFMNPVTWLLQLTPFFGVIAFVSSAKKSFLPIGSLILGLITIFIYFLSGARGTMMFVAAPVLFFLFYFNWNKGLKFWIFTSLLLSLMVGMMELQVRFRGNLLDVIFSPQESAKEKGFNSVTTFDPSKSHRDNNTYLLCLLIEAHPERYQFDGFNSFYATLLNPIPRALWPGKPVLIGARDISFQPQWVLDGPLLMGTTSLTYSIVGEGYLASGFWGILIYASFYSMFLLFFDGIFYYVNEEQILAIGLLAIGVFLSFWGFRSLVALMMFVYPIACLVLAMKLIEVVRR